MVVRLHLVLKLLKFLDLLFDCFHALFDFGMLVTVFFGWHSSPPTACEILTFKRLDFKLPLAHQAA